MCVCGELLREHTYCEAGIGVIAPIPYYQNVLFFVWHVARRQEGVSRRQEAVRERYSRLKRESNIDDKSISRLLVRAYEFFMI